MSEIIVYDTTLRDGMQGEGMSLSVEEKVRVAQILDELGVPMIEAGFPTSNPKELELFERRHLRVRDDAPARRRRRGGRRAARARGVLDAGLDDRRQDLGPASGEGRQGRP
jgi:isopropylmalate/homocitrate/citramalate synthase